MCDWDLLSRVASLEDPDVSIKDETFDFNQRFVSDAKARLLRDGKTLDVSSFQIPIGDQARMMKLLFASERSLGNQRIEAWFS